MPKSLTYYNGTNLKHLKIVKLLSITTLYLFSFFLSFAQTYNLKPYQENKKWGYIDQNDSIVIPAKYNHATAFNEGLAAVRIDELFGYINTKGKTIIDFKYRSADNFKNGQARISMLPEHATVKDPDLPGFIIFYNIINKKGKVLLKWEFNYIAEFHDGLAMVYKGTYHKHISGFINTELRVVINLKYQNAEDFNNGKAKIKLNGKWGYIDKNGIEYFEN